MRTLDTHAASHPRTGLPRLAQQNEWVYFPETDICRTSEKLDREESRDSGAPQTDHSLPLREHRRKLLVPAGGPSPLTLPELLRSLAKPRMAIGAGEPGEPGPREESPVAV